jgi:hypothetical protein
MILSVGLDSAMPRFCLLTQLAKLDKVDALVSSVEVTRSVVERLERRIDQRHGND